MNTLAICAEFGQTFGGDIGLAVEMVHAFAEAGATHVKVQMLDPDTIATPTALSYWHTGPRTYQRDAFNRAGLVGHSAWTKVRDACDQAKVGFVATPFDFRAVQALRDLNPAAVKVASGDITFTPLLRAVAGLHRPVWLSTGASTMLEVAHAMEAIDDVYPTHTTPLACTLEYPTHRPNLARIHELREWTGSAAVGYSDHTLTVLTSYHAVLAGAVVLERHVTMRKDDPSCPDNAMASTPTAFSAYVTNARAAQELLGARLSPTAGEHAARHGARRAARWAYSLPAGHVVTLDDFAFLRPDPSGDGTSIDAAMLLVGRTLDREVSAGAIVDAAVPTKEEARGATSSQHA